MPAPDLSTHAARAIAHVESLSTGPALDTSLRITVHFHPDRLVHGVPILRALRDDGVYRSQFETGVSNGGLTAYPGGDRWNWESRIFNRAYDDVPPSARPKYGALNVDRSSQGASPRFGSSYFRLAAHTLGRSTFCFLDSYYNPSHFATSSRFDLHKHLSDDSVAPDIDPLDHYIEAHVHDDIVLSRDVEALVLDPSFRDTEVERHARDLSCAIEWHHGFTLSTNVLAAHPEYRGKRYVDIGCAVAEQSVLTPRLIGVAARAGAYDPQDLKKVWHYLARFGRPSTRTV